MIFEISLKQFKCFEGLVLPLRSLTLLSGTNASGKSSVLQSLVLLHQTMHSHEWSNRLLLNGKELNLGTVSDVVNKISGRRSFDISVNSSTEKFQWSFFGERSEMSMGIECVEVNGEYNTDPENLQFLAPKTEVPSNLLQRIKGLTYITAERVGPREFYALEDTEELTSVGSSGEHAVGLLFNGRDEKILKDLILEDARPLRLQQVEARMREFFPGCGISVQQVPQANAVTLGIRTSDETDHHRPIHVGFGLTQVFPIIVAILSAKENDLILIENPEVHLHPAGQAMIGQFLAQAAHAGIQIILETHSDHVLNGIRRAVKSKAISSQEVALHFFRSKSDKMAQVHSPQIDANGNLDSWPEGFFDQFDKDMDYFASWGQ